MNQSDTKSEYEKARDEAASGYHKKSFKGMPNGWPHATDIFSSGFDSGASYRLKEIVGWLRSTNIFLSMCENDEIADEIEKKFGGANE